MSEPQSQENLVRTFRLDDASLAELLDRLDTTDRDARPARAHERYNYRLNRCVMHMQQPGSGLSTAYIVATRNLSAGGLSALHGGYVHAGTRCVVQLISTHSAWTIVPGTVVRCQYVQGKIHEVGIVFDNLIDPANFCPEAAKTRVLLAEDDLAITRLVTAHLTRLNAEVDHAEDGQIAVQKALSGVYDVVMMDIEMPVMDGIEATKELRESGYTGLIVADTALTQPEDRQRCLQAGCDRYIAKPYSREDLAKLIESLRQEPLFSTFQNDVSMRDLIDAFVAELPAKVRALEEAMVSQDAKKLESLVRSLKGAAGGYGFEPITELAAKLESALIQNTPIGQLQESLNELLNWCLLARSSASVTQGVS